MVENRKFEPFRPHDISGLISETSLAPYKTMTDLQFFGWFMLTGVCLFAVGEIRYRAARYQRRWLLWFLILPGTVLSYEAWFILKKVAVDVRHNWRIYFFVLWIALTYYLWERGNEYKRQLEQERKH